jgi:hypothetical protein
MLQGSGRRVHRLTAFRFGKSFLKDDKAHAEFYGKYSPFQKFRHWSNTLSGPALYAQTQESTFQMRRFGIGFTYKFGKLEGDIARKKRGIENDDVKRWRWRRRVIKVGFRKVNM